MTSAAAAALPVTDPEVWRQQVVDRHELASCAAWTVQLSAGPRDSSAVHVSVTATRTVQSDTGASSATWREDRRVVLTGGTWLVDAAVVGG